jgi:antitoxin HicB
MEAQKAWGREYPRPTVSGMSGKFVQRLPKSLHAKLVKRAKQEGVSLNTLVLALIAEGIGKREGTGLSA